jgi:hypothetical protein
MHFRLQNFVIAWCGTLNWVGDGSGVSFWFDVWYVDETLAS